MSNGLFDVLALQGISFPSTNVSSEITAGFGKKNARNTAYISINTATFTTDAYLSLFLGVGTKSVTAAQAKQLLGVTAGETVTLYCEMFADDLSGSRLGRMEVDFYQEDGTHVGSTEYVEVAEAAGWEQKKKEIVVPATATRLNFYLRAGCGAGETVQVWLAKLKVTR